jgi:hypothetical protein
LKDKIAFGIWVDFFQKNAENRNSQEMKIFVEKLKN